MNLYWSAEMGHPFFTSSIYHEWKIHSRSRGIISSAGGMTLHILAYPFLFVWRLGTDGAVHREHTSSCGAPKGGMVDIVIEDSNVAGIRFDGYACREAPMAARQKVLASY